MKTPKKDKDDDEMINFSVDSQKQQDQMMAVKKKRFNCFLPADIYKNLQLIAIDEETNMTELVIKAIKEKYDI